jgi:KipI family sensor histidine kinase inhibitor
MRALAAGDAAVLLDPPAAGSAAGLAAAVRALDLAGVLDIIPGARSVLVTTEPGSWDPAELARVLADVRPAADAASADAPPLEFDVCYDGPDLADVAALTGLPVAEVIARHTAAEYRVGWLGFLPGFGYLTGLDPALGGVPRLDTPRLAVPAGSVAIAGGLAAVYPATSPGGWRVLGRTDARLWDPRRDPPALFAPGTRVRFRAVAGLPSGADARADAAAPAPATPRPAAPSPATPSLAASTLVSKAATAPAAGATASAVAGQGPAGLAPAAGSRTDRRVAEVVQPGPLLTVQDLGRRGLGHLGVPHSGAADAGSLRRANALAGNAPGAAGLEVTLGRLVLRFRCDATVAVTGAPAPVRLRTADGAEHQPTPGRAFGVPAGAVLRLGSPAAGLRSYLAIDGGIDVAPVLGSRSADLLSGLGPAPLRAGTELPLGSPRALAGAGQLAGQSQPPAGQRRGQDGLPAPGATVELAVIAGPRDDWFTAEALESLASGSYQVTPASNRTGLRLSGPPLRRRRVAELPSEGMATGSLQVAHDGQPILLLADHPTTGGYPVIAVVRAADLGLAGQLRPGQQVRFRFLAAG